MTRVVYYCATSLDGYIAEADDTIDWLTGYTGSYRGEGARPLEGSYEEFFAGVGALVSGSATYAFVQRHVEAGGEWPYPNTPWWVLSSRGRAVPDGDGVDVRFRAGPVSDLYGELAASAGADALWVVGGGNVASQFADAGLLDELRIHLVPVVLAGGKPLFERTLARPMQLEAVQPRDNGMVELRYTLPRP
jgi:dihydrofolate reductase